ncbi:hypothetical protein K438DRAFT_1764574 [Mycena galopus ATCC 62051]|nr:hypothetical protein K438DRAFT_1764574 [Mycena galopus ATCC 62051]
MVNTLNLFLAVVLVVTSVNALPIVERDIGMEQLAARGHPTRTASLTATKASAGKAGQAAVSAVVAAIAQVSAAAGAAQSQFNVSAANDLDGQLAGFQNKLQLDTQAVINDNQAIQALTANGTALTADQQSQLAALQVKLQLDTQAVVDDNSQIQDLEDNINNPEINDGEGSF